MAMACTSQSQVMRHTGRNSMTVEAPQLSARLRELPLAQLRSYRCELREEEHRVSYWRRLLQARLDMVAAGHLSQGPLTPRQIGIALGDGVRRRERLALIVLDAGGDLPELPELGRLWATPLDSGDAEEDARVVAALAEAEAQLSTYRVTVHRLLDVATTELIRRYHDDPAACLHALPPRRAD
jgi:hypothetical protein